MTGSSHNIDSIAAARVHQAGAILTNDKLRAGRVTQPQVLLLDSYL